LPAILTDLRGRGVGRLMVEGGTRILTQFLTAGLVNELHLAVAPFFVGQPEAPQPSAKPLQIRGSDADAQQGGLDVEAVDDVQDGLPDGRAVRRQPGVDQRVLVLETEAGVDIGEGGGAGGVIVGDRVGLDPDERLHHEGDQPGAGAVESKTERTSREREVRAWDSGTVSQIRGRLSDLPRSCDTGHRDPARTRSRGAAAHPRRSSPRARQLTLIRRRRAGLCSGVWRIPRSRRFPVGTGHGWPTGRRVRGGRWCCCTGSPSPRRCGSVTGWPRRSPTSATGC